MNARVQAALPADEVHARQQFISDVFHAISQPLTALRCSIELTLMRDGTAETYRQALEQALHHAERVTSCAEFLRLMAEADDPGTPCETTLSSCVLAAVEEFAPVFEANSRMLAVRCEARPQIFVDPDRVQRALFLVLDFCAAERRHAILRVQAPARLQISYGRAGSGTDDQNRRSRARQSLALAERMLAASGAEVKAAHNAQQRQLSIAWDAIAP